MKENNPLLHTQVEEIYGLLNELKNSQESSNEYAQKKFNIILNKLMKLEEYNKIEDMTNQVFDMRLSNIENFLYRINEIVKQNG